MPKVSFSFQEKIRLFLLFTGCIFFGIRFYPHDWHKTLWDSLRWIGSFLFYGGVIAYIFHGLSKKLFKRPFSLKEGIKLALGLAFFFSLTQAIHEFLKGTTP